MKLKIRNMSSGVLCRTVLVLSFALAAGMQTAAADALNPADPVGMGLNAPLSDGVLSGVRGRGAETDLKVGNQVAVVLWDELNKQGTRGGNNGQLTQDRGSNNHQVNSILISRQ
ncbi:hypothetical protein [Acidihalobacter prosperus]|nr:hypothetical protein [Acidihalobacter prosperus]